MTIETLSDQEFDRDSRRARTANLDGVIVITVDGKPAQVVMSYNEYISMGGSSEGQLKHSEFVPMTKREKTIAEALASPETSDFDFDHYLPRRHDFPREIDLE